MDTFGVGETGLVSYLPKDRAGFEVRAVFDNAYQAIDPTTQEVITSTKPMIGVKLADFEEKLAKPRQDDKVIIKEVTYTVIDVQPDGQGGASLILHRDIASATRRAK